MKLSHLLGFTKNSFTKELVFGSSTSVTRRNLIFVCFINGSLVFSPHMYKVLYFGNHFYSTNARKLRFHVFLHFNVRKHMISSFYLKWTEFTRDCEFVPT